MNNQPVGMHIIPVFLDSAQPLKLGAAQIETLREHCSNVCMQYHIEFVTLSVQRDHLHILIALAHVPEGVGDMVRIMLDGVIDLMREFTNNPTWDTEEIVHLMMLPPWHVELFRAFINQQDEYHTRYTLIDEIHNIMAKGGGGSAHAEATINPSNVN